jgi:hypothetical protein
VLKFKSVDEQRAWMLADTLDTKGAAALLEAEEAAATYRNGKMLNRRQCRARGISEADADIRWSGTQRAKKALTDNAWYMAQATMYSEASAAQYAKALYLSQTDGAG